MDTLTKVISLFDVHAPHEISFDGILKFLKKEKPNLLILGGDFMNIDSLSRWSLAGGKRLTLEGKRFAKECKYAEALLDRLQLASGKDCKIIYLEGNHEDWVNQYIEQHPEMQGIIDLPLMLNLEERGIAWIPYRSKDNYYKVGKLFYTHGDYCNVHHARKMVSSWNCNVRYGHVHTHQVFTSSSKRGISDQNKAIAIPCLCKDGSYMESRPTSWSHGFHIAHINKRGDFWENVIQINKGKFMFDGITYE